MNEPELRKVLAHVGLTDLHKNSRGWLVAPCPFAPWTHASGVDSNPSFNVHINDEGYSGYNCFACHVRGTIPDMLRQLGTRQQNEALLKLATKVLLDEARNPLPNFEAVRFGHMDNAGPALSREEEVAYLRMFPLALSSPQAMRFLEGRNVSQEATELLRLRWDAEQGRVLFPVFDGSGRLCGFSGRAVREGQNPKVRDYAGIRKEECLLGEEAMRGDVPVVVVEGLFAYARLVSEGCREFCDVVATLGSWMSDAQVGALADNGAPVFLLYDLDKAGEDGIYGTPGRPGAAERLCRDVHVSVCLYPEGVDDVDDLNATEVRKMLFGGGSIPWSEQVS